MNIECAYNTLVKNQIVPVKSELNDRIDKFFDSYAEYNTQYCSFIFKGLGRQACKNLYRHFRIEGSRFTYLKPIYRGSASFSTPLEEFNDICDITKIKNILLDEMIQFANTAKEFILYEYIRFFNKYNIY